MSVTTAGVKGYEYQYKATTVAALHHLTNAKEIFVEKKGSEDATILISQKDTTRIIEIQSKNTNAPVTMSLLTDWLCHFQEHSAADNLLSRIIKTSTITALVITSGRCQDHTEIFRKPLPVLDEHVDLKLSQEWKLLFIDELNDNKYKGQTDLQKQRDKFCKNQAKEIINSGLPKESLKRLIIWEQINDGELDRTIESILNKIYNIPQSLTSTTYLHLLEAVKTGRDSGVDIFPIFKQILAQAKGEAPLLDSNYKTRKEENELISELEKHGLLLLTGRTQCGKSEIAKKIASHFYEKGYAYRICSDINAVDSFFNQYAIEDKVCILEDPWGHVEPGIDSLDIFRKLETLVKNSKSNHKLIITTREEILNKLTRNYQRAETIKGRSWKNTTITDKNVIADFWKLFAQDRSIDTSVQSKIENEIFNSSNNTILQLGELQHLVRYDQDLNEKSVEELLHIARQTSEEIASDLITKNPAAAELIAIIASCADTTINLSLLNLGYIISTDNTKYSILSEDDFASDNWEENNTFPGYPQAFELPDSWMQQLEYLENRGLLIIRNNQILFSHPNYFEAAKKLLISTSNLRQERILNYINKAVTSISPQNALKAVKQLNYIFESVFTDFQHSTIDIAFLALNSIFPSVRDQSLVFLVSKLSKLPTDKKYKLEQILESPDTSSASIFWHKDIPYISEKGDVLQDRYFKLAAEDYQEIRKKFDADQLVTSLEAWNYIRTLYNSPGVNLTCKEANYLMRYDETFIRKRATELMISRSSAILNKELINLIIADQHPSVIFTAINNILKYWRNWDPSVKSNLKTIIISSLNHAPIAIRCNQLLTTFETEYSSDSIPWKIYKEHEKKELWNVWAELYVPFILKLPADAFLNPGRFGNTIDTAFKYLEKDNGMLVLNAWYDRIDYKIQNNRELDEFELAIADVLIDFTGTDVSSRAVLFEKLLKYNDTGFIISTLKWIMRHWDKLNEHEREKIINIVHQDRKDKRWIKAILITRHSSPPAELQLAIFKNASFFNLSVKDFIKSIDTQLLEDSLKVYFGHPQPLWWYATQYNNIQFWQPIVNYVLINNIDPFYEICISEISSWGLNGFSGPWKDGLATWRGICENTSDKSELAKRLVYDTSRINYVLTTAKEMYSILIGVYVKAGKENEIINLLADNIELLQQGGHGAEDLIEILEAEMISKIYSQLQPDANLYQSVINFEKDPSKKGEFVTLIKEINQKGLSIRFNLTKKIIKKILSRMSILPEFEEQIDNIKDDIGLIDEVKKKALSVKDEYKLPDWIG